eukprot:Rhum_TRINITY_DN4707_c0_g1::Rhum_TRINITY_DN4707_c0_g1_i1::g.15441::m.15441
MELVVTMAGCHDVVVEFEFDDDFLTFKERVREAIGIEGTEGWLLQNPATMLTMRTADDFKMLSDGDSLRVVETLQARRNRERALLTAVRRGDVTACKSLIGKGFDVNSDAMLPMYHAATAGHLEVVRILIDAGANVNKQHLGYTPLSQAALNGRISVMKLLLEHGADVDYDTLGQSALIRACADTSDTAAIECLLDNGANVHKTHKDCTPLYFAAEEGHVQQVKILIARGAVLDTPCDHGMTALHIAAQGGHAETVRTLLDAGAARDIQDEYGRTPYHAATQQDVSQYLSGSIDLGISSQAS